MQSDSLESLLSEAEQLEKKYQWFQAAEIYQDAYKLAIDQKDVLKAAELQEKEGYSFYRAAFQAKSNAEFRDTMKLGVQAYQKESELLKGINEVKSKIRIKHADAMVAYLQCWIETAPAQKKQLITKWWNLENQVLQAYEQTGDTRSVGITCKNLVEYCCYHRFPIVYSFSEYLAVYKECTALAEKAIKIFQRFDDEYELAKAYCFASWYYTFSNTFLDSEERIRQLHQRAKEYLSRTMELAQKTGDAWLIGWSNFTSWSLNSNMVNPDPSLAIKFAETTLNYGKITRDNFLIGTGKLWMAASTWTLTVTEEDPDKQKENYKEEKRLSQEAEQHFEIINHTVSLYYSLHIHSEALNNLAKIEPDLKTKQALLENAIEVIQKGRARFQGWKLYHDSILVVLTKSLWLLAETKTEIKEKRKLLFKAQSTIKKSIAFLKEMLRFSYGFHADNYHHLAMVQEELANTEKNSTAKLALLHQATVSMEKGLNIVERKKNIYQVPAANRFVGVLNRTLAGIQTQIFSLRRDKQSLFKALEAYRQSSVFFEKAEMPTHAAESYWHMAQLYDQTENQQEASKNYESASQAYDLAADKIPQLKQFYKNYSLYMKAWSQIEQARHSHKLEHYDKAKEHYLNAAENHESSEFWSYLTPNYFAWANMEEAEVLSRKENTQQAKQTFQISYEQFSEAADSFKKKLKEITSPEEKEMLQKVFEASDLRRKYCEARILMEEAKLLDREGNHLEGSEKYVKAAQKISAIAEIIDIGAERKELEYVSVLCRAWGKMADAEEATSSEAYLEAAEFFEEAKDYCFTRKASLWALGNSNFCRGLAAGVNYQTRLDVEEHTRAKGYIKNAATNYLKAGYEHASEYAKGTQRLFDAYLFMNQAEGESDTEKRVKQYQLAENLLQLAADSFTKAKQPEKIEQVQQMLVNVREEKELAISFNEVLQAPTIASSTSTFKAPTSTSEASVGLDKFEHANVQANLVAEVKEVKVGESFCLSVECVNAGREPALLTRVEDFVPPDFLVVRKPEIYRLEDSCLNLKGKQIEPLKLVEAKLVLQPLKKGVYQVEPMIHYLNELGQAKSLKLKSVEIKVEEVILADRVSTGTKELNMLLLGGIPREYAVALTGPASDERELVITNFLQAGAGEGETSFYVAVEPVSLEGLLEKPNFHLFLCNPKPKVTVPDLPNVYKLHSKADINNLNISLFRAYRTVDQSSSKRICIEVVSDVLVTYGVKTTRKWISELITDLSSKGFTMLAAIDPSMHPADQASAILNLFDGEISLLQTEDPLECKKSIRVKRLRNQDFIKNPICLR